MLRKSLLLLIAVSMTGLIAACDDGQDEFADIDTEWNSADSAFLVEYETVRGNYDQLESDYNTMPASDDTVIVNQRTTVQERLQANRQRLQEIENQRAEALRRRDAARAANDREAYQAARKEVDYAAWEADLDRLRTEREELEGMIMVGSKSVGGVDVNVKDTNDPLLRVEPGKEDDEPLIELNKNP